ncbi:MAG: helix-turn-helix transcriptional regulator [Granulosicoccaceae bacterium]
MYQKDVGMLLGVDTSTITGWDRNDHLPHISHYPQIANFLGYAPTQLNLNQRNPSNKLLYLRQQAGLTQKAAAKLLGIHYSTLSEYENMKGLRKNREYCI